MRRSAGCPAGSTAATSGRRRARRARRRRRLARRRRRRDAEDRLRGRAERAWTIATSAWPRSAAPTSCVSAVAPSIGAHARPVRVAARPLVAERRSARAPAARCRRCTRLPRAPRRRRRRLRRRGEQRRACRRSGRQAREGRRRAARVGGADREAERVADVVRAEERLRSSVDAAQRRAVRAHRVAAEPLVRVGDLARAGPRARRRRTAGRPASACPATIGSPADGRTAAPTAGVAEAAGDERGEQRAPAAGPARRRGREGVGTPSERPAMVVRMSGSADRRSLVSLPWAALLACASSLWPLPSFGVRLERPRHRPLRRRGRRSSSPDDHVPAAESLNVQVVRMTLTWGGRGGVANKRPATPTDPADPAYDWARYDRAIERANDAGIQVLLTIVGTPAWANGGQAAERPPSSATTLRRVRLRRRAPLQRHVPRHRERPRAAARRPVARLERAEQPRLPPAAVRARAREVAMAAAAAYAQICNAVYAGVHAAGGPRAGRLRRDRAARLERPDERRGPRSRRSRSCGRSRRAASAPSTPGRTTRTTAARADAGDAQRRPARGRARATSTR